MVRQEVVTFDAWAELINNFKRHFAGKPTGAITLRFRGVFHAQNIATEETYSENKNDDDDDNYYNYN